MPLPAARHALPHVGAPGDQRPGALARANAQVRGLLRGGQRAQRQVRVPERALVQRRDLRGLSEAAHSASRPRQAHGAGPGQCEVPPCAIACAAATKVLQGAHAAVPTALQSAAQHDRTALEACAPARHPQPVLRDPRGLDPGGLDPVPPLAKTQHGAAKIMLYHLGRCV